MMRSKVLIPHLGIPKSGAGSLIAQAALKVPADYAAASIEQSVVEAQLASQRPKWRFGQSRF